MIVPKFEDTLTVTPASGAAERTTPMGSEVSPFIAKLAFVKEIRAC